VTPNAVTAFTLLLSAVAGAVIAAGWFVAGGLLIHAVSVVDGVDGEVARRKGMATRFGGFLDSLTDRYADAFMLAGMAVYSIRYEDTWHPELAGALALAGSLTVSYSRARIEASLGAQAAGGRTQGPAATEQEPGDTEHEAGADGDRTAVGSPLSHEGGRGAGGEGLLYGIASRDVRSLVMAITTVVGLCSWGLWAVAGLAAATVAWRLAYLRLTVGRRLPATTPSP
jgi:hypothetical protein